MNISPAEFRDKLTAQMGERLQPIEDLFREYGVQAEVVLINFSEDQKQKIRSNLSEYYKQTTADQMIDRYTAEINRGITANVGKSEDEYLMYHEIIVSKLWSEMEKHGSIEDRVRRAVHGQLSSQEKDQIGCISLAFLNQVEWLKIPLAKYLLAGLSDHAVQALKSFFEERGLSEMVEQVHGGDPIKAILHAYPSAGEAVNTIFKILDKLSTRAPRPEGMRLGTFISEHTLWASESEKEL